MSSLARRRSPEDLAFVEASEGPARDNLSPGAARAAGAATGADEGGRRGAAFDRRLLRRLAPAWFLLGDLLALAAAFVLSALAAAWINEVLIGRYYGPIDNPRLLALRALEYLTMALLLFAWLSSRGSYRQRSPFWEEFRTLLIGVVGVALLDSFLQYVRQEQFSRLWLLQNWLLAVLLLVAGRALMRRLLDRAGIWGLPTLVVGSGANAGEVMAALRSQKHLGYRVVGHADLEAGRFVPLGRRPEQRLGGLGEKGAPRDPVAALLELVEREDVDSVVLAFDAADLPQHQDLVRALSRRRIAYSVAPPLRGMAVFGLEAQHFFGHDVVLLSTRNNLDRPFDRALKRLFDLVLAGAGLIVLGPLMLLLAGLVRLDGGPALYGHRRVGRGGRPFRCLKFRSMAPDAERRLQALLARDAAAAAEWARDFKLRKDPRVTRLGRFLRRSSLYELPQLINVLRGEMSLVGPRPIIEAELALYGDDAVYYLETRPGITGLWQVSGRNDVSYDRRVAMDAWYVRNWSIWHDIAILARTPGAVCRRSGVY